jgi:hypothetical protein
VLAHPIGKQFIELKLVEAPLNWIKELPVLPRQRVTKDAYKRKLATRISVRKIHPTIHYKK